MYEIRVPEEWFTSRQLKEIEWIWIFEGVSLITGVRARWTLVSIRNNGIQTSFTKNLSEFFRSKNFKYESE